MTHFEIFPVAIGQYEYNDHANLKLAIRDIMHHATEKRISTNAIHYFEQSGSFLELPSLKNFKEFLEDSVNHYANNLLKLNTEFFVTLGWINQTHTNCVMGNHNHGNSYFSGTYYLNYNPIVHEPLAFVKELEFAAQSPYMGIIPQSYNTFNAPGYRVTEAKEGELIAWPSHLLHGHGPNKADDRISISMNFLPKYITNGIYKFKISK